MYGNYDLPFSIEKRGISVSMEKREKLWIYKRRFGEDKVEKQIRGWKVYNYKSCRAS
jgi:hypothetical protein